MALPRIIALAALSAFMMTQAGYAFTVDDQSMNTPSASANFGDPDEKTPTPVLTVRGPNQFSGNSASQDQGDNLPPSARAPMFMPLPPAR